jgi:hypothetical protein
VAPWVDASGETQGEEARTLTLGKKSSGGKGDKLSLHGFDACHP